ncbi:MAG: PH domain-containing protein, partial [Fervidicoccaceae archaeon]
MSVGRRAIVAVSVTIVAAVAFSAWLGPEWCPPSSALLGAGLGLVFGIVPTLWALAPRLCGLSLELRSGRLVAKFGGAEIAVDLEEIEEARLVESFERLVRIGGAALPGCYAGRFAARGVGSFRLYGERPSPALLVKLREGRALAFATRDRALLESLSRQLSEARAGGGPARRPAQISSGPSGMLLALTLLVLAAASVLAV